MVCGSKSIYVHKKTMPSFEKVFEEVDKEYFKEFKGYGHFLHFSKPNDVAKVLADLIDEI